MSPTRRSPEKHLLPDFFDDYPEQWLGFGSVEEEILRGAGLRLHKPDYSITCDNVAYEMPLPIATGFEKKKKKKYSKRSDAIHTTPCSPRPCSPDICRNSATLTDMCVGGPGSCSSSAHHYWSKKCPLRIAELAQPKKRQCIENIKDNAHRLPPIMLERLRQRINDDRPLAAIPDAINCFKIRRPPPRRTKCVNDWKTYCNSIQKENLKRMEIRDLCVVFGHGLVTKLAIPMAISLDSELKRLSAIVESDISQIMKCNKLIYDTKASDCEKIRKEIADKVTAWIDTVLEESKNRLVDEDIKEPKIQVNLTRCGGGDNVVTVIENQHTVSVNTSRAEMEEEIGPVLDFVDDLVNTVMGSVETEDNDTDSYMEALGSDIGGTNKSKYDTADSDEDTENIAKLILEKIKPLSSANDFYRKIPLVDKDNVEEDIENVNDSNESANDLNESDTDGAAVDTNTDIGSAPDLTQQTDAEIINAEPDEVKEYNNFGAEVSSSAFVDNVVEEEGQLNETMNPTDDNKIVGILHKEDSMVDKNKAVKFSNVDMVIEEEVPEPESNESTITSTKLIDFKYVPVKKHSIYDSYPLDSALAPPNINLLSEADESWPDDITTYGMTINATITQSITSLGRIVESDQELLHDREDDKKLNTEEYLLLTDLNSLDGSNTHFKYHEHRNADLQTLRSDSDKLEYVGNENTQICGADKDAVRSDSDKLEYVGNENTQICGADKNAVRSDSDKLEYVGNENTQICGADKDAVRSDSDKLEYVGNENTQMCGADKDIPKYDDNKSEKTQIPEPDIDTLQGDHENRNHKMEVSVELASKEIEKEKENTINQKDLEGFEKCKGDHKDVDREKTHTKEFLQQHTPDKFEYKVNLKTAPAWVSLLATDNGCNCLIDVNRPKKETKNLEIKKWCKDLDSAYEGLEQWSLWIKAACKEVIELKHKFQDIKKPYSHHYCQRRVKEWSRLKKDIDKDTILWTKLYQRAHGTLKAYTEKQKRKLTSTSIQILENSSNGTQELVSVFDYVDTLHFRTYQLVI